jgi:hypothetical protein
MNTERKHHSQMSRAELDKVTAIVRSIEPKFRSYGHTAQRLNERAVSEQEIRDTLLNGRVIEVSLTDRQDVRTLVRWDSQTEAIVVAVSLRTGFICTAWKNSLADNHRTLNMGLYSRTLNVAALL